jgi:hypothetical protein
MRQANPNECVIDDGPGGTILTAEMPEDELVDLFPIPMDHFDPLTQAEPSIGALVQLDSGQYLGVRYGTVSNTLVIEKPYGADSGEAVAALMREVSIPEKVITWVFLTKGTDDFE